MSEIIQNIDVTTAVKTTDWNDQLLIKEQRKQTEGRCGAFREKQFVRSLVLWLGLHIFTRLGDEEQTPY